ncbi:MAG: hypothetical protein CM1200mP29_04010 [Verrucomicrobiota bacterium]|nr:MAG: hypothetical protein CM1200mP29_04010 [Verrucomicrobiota bacterium]
MKICSSAFRGEKERWSSPNLGEMMMAEVVIDASGVRLASGVPAV